MTLGVSLTPLVVTLETHGEAVMMALLLGTTARPVECKLSHPDLQRMECCQRWFQRWYRHRLDADKRVGGDNILSCWHVHSCNQAGHFARECPNKPPGGGLTDECFNYVEFGHNKADCTNPRVEREFTGTCNACGVEGHAARSCPTKPMKCKLCHQEGHKALECKERRIVDWSGVPELEAEEAWAKLIDAAR